MTTWSVRDLRWAGVRFTDFHAHCVPHFGVANDATLAVFHRMDGYRSALPLTHGAPLRLVAPAHDGYKNVKHLVKIEYLRDTSSYRFAFPYPQFVEHPRAWVALEERARGWPAWLLRPFYCLLAPLVRRRSRRTLVHHQAE